MALADHANRGRVGSDMSKRPTNCAVAPAARASAAEVVGGPSARQALQAAQPVSAEPRAAANVEIGKIAIGRTIVECSDRPPAGKDSSAEPETQLLGCGPTDLARDIDSMRLALRQRLDRQAPNPPSAPGAPERRRVVRRREVYTHP